MKKEELPSIGKIPPEIFDAIIYPRLGARSKRILTGPRHGVDCGIVDLGGGQVMAVTCDPLFVVPQYGWERAAWFAFHILASDIATSGLKPAYLAVDMNLPLTTSRADLEAFWSVFHRECVKYGVSIVTGHTAKYAGCQYPMIGGATMMAMGRRDSYVTTEMARPGDMIIITKGAAIEAAGLFAVTFPRFIAERCGTDFACQAEKLFWQMSTVDDALAAAAIGLRDRGVSAMHDATECGVWGGLYEIARASGVGLHIDQGAVPVSDAAAKICELFRIDPYASISEGTLLLTCREHHTGRLMKAFKRRGIPAAVIGEILRPERGIKILSGRRERTLTHPVVDPFWQAYSRALDALL
ncbi:MAG: AIR synthase [Elusimicrobia bacterium]|nr:AIR synthase [Elusimicrobiota bacterium]